MHAGFGGDVADAADDAAAAHDEGLEGEVCGSAEAHEWLGLLVVVGSGGVEGRLRWGSGGGGGGDAGEFAGVATSKLTANNVGMFG